MLHDRKCPLVLFAEDDDEDWMLIEDAFALCPFAKQLERVKDGIALMKRLRDPKGQRPALVLLDLKMPMKNGHEALEEIRADDKLRAIPVVIMTGSRSEADIYRSYFNGANSYIAKPVSLANLDIIRRYWNDVVSFPPPVAP